MSDDLVMGAGAEALKVILMISTPMLLAAMVVGLVVSVFQAVTQINEATLTFIPKMAAIVLVLLVLSPWMLESLQTYATNIFGHLDQWVR